MVVAETFVASEDLEQTFLDLQSCHLAKRSQAPPLPLRLLSLHSVEVHQFHLPKLQRDGPGELVLKQREDGEPCEIP